jgi:hypothetical protein
MNFFSLQHSFLQISRTVLRYPTRTYQELSRGSRSKVSFVVSKAEENR